MFYGTYNVLVKDNSVNIPFELGNEKCKIYCMCDVENIVFLQVWKISDSVKTLEYEKDFEILCSYEQVIDEKNFVLPKEFLDYLGEEKNVRISGVIDYIDIIKESDFKELSDEEIDKLLDF